MESRRLRDDRFVVLVVCEVAFLLACLLALSSQWWRGRYSVCCCWRTNPKPFFVQEARVRVSTRWMNGNANRNVRSSTRRLMWTKSRSLQWCDDTTKRASWIYNNEIATKGFDPRHDLWGYYYANSTTSVQKKKCRCFFFCVCVRFAACRLLSQKNNNPNQWWVGRCTMILGIVLCSGGRQRQRQRQEGKKKKILRDAVTSYVW